MIVVGAVVALALASGTPASLRTRGTMAGRTVGAAVGGGSLEGAAVAVCAVGASASGSASTTAARRLLRKKTSPATAPATHTSANKLMAMIAQPLPPLFLLKPGPGRVLVGGRGRHGGWAGGGG
jgi:hypothetical protein